VHGLCRHDKPHEIALLPEVLISHSTSVSRLAFEMRDQITRTQHGVLLDRLDPSATSIRHSAHFARMYAPANSAVSSTCPFIAVSTSVFVDDEGTLSSVSRAYRVNR
jgi:hypothetical protein